MNGFWNKASSWCSLPNFGLIVTANYLLGATYLLYDRVDQLKTMPLNEIGDFLAGIFGALAFFWLVIGYFMQNKELSLSRETLNHQLKEFKNSIDQQKIQNDILEKELQILESERQDKLRKLKPNFKNLKIEALFSERSILKKDPNTGDKKLYRTDFNGLNIFLKNNGAEIFDCTVSLFNKDKSQKISSNLLPKIGNRMDKNLALTIKTDLIANGQLDIKDLFFLEISFLDSHNTKSQVLYFLDHKENSDIDFKLLGSN